MVRERDIPAAVMEAVIVLIALGLAFIAGIAGWTVGHSTRHTTTPPASSISAAPIDPHVAAGAHDFVQFACAQCHGERGRGDVTPDVPALIAVARQLTPAQLHARALSMVGSPTRPTRPSMACEYALSYCECKQFARAKLAHMLFSLSIKMHGPPVLHGFDAARFGRKTRREPSNAPEPSFEPVGRCSATSTVILLPGVRLFPWRRWRTSRGTRSSPSPAPTWRRCARRSSASASARRVSATFFGGLLRISREPRH